MVSFFVLAFQGRITAMERRAPSYAPVHKHRPPLPAPHLAEDRPKPVRLLEHLSRGVAGEQLSQGV